MNSLLIRALQSLEQRRQTRERADPAELGARLRLALDPWQRDALRSSSPRLLFCCSRQSGKSLVASLAAMHTAIYKPGSLVLILSPSLRQSSELFRKCLSLYRTIAGEYPAESETVLRLELSNGSRLLSLPGGEKQIRGFSSVALIIADEAARIPDELYHALTPMLSVSRGRFIGLSTPFGARGWFYQVWKEGAGFERYKITAAECPRISSEFLAEERQRMPHQIYRSEYECEFVEAVDSVFRADDIEAAFPKDYPVKALFT